MNFVPAALFSPYSERISKGNSNYKGNWRSNNGSTIEIRRNGMGYAKIINDKGAIRSTEKASGALFIHENKIVINTILWFETEYKIMKKPYKDASGSWCMEMNGMIFKK